MKQSDAGNDVKTLALITVFESIIGDRTLQAVNARELWEFLQVKTRFDDWARRRIEEYGFVQGIDFTVFLNSEENSSGRPPKEYHITLDMAKELSMVERTPRGKEARLYFIECEKKLSKQQRANYDLVVHLKSCTARITRAMEKNTEDIIETRHAVGWIKNDVQEVKEDIKGVKEDVFEMKDTMSRVIDILPAIKVSAGNERIHRAFVLYQWGGYDPIDQRVRLVDEEGQLIKDPDGKVVGQCDHWINRQTPDLQATWLITRELNQYLRSNSGDKLQKYSFYFGVYQDRLEAYCSKYSDFIAGLKKSRKRQQKNIGQCLLKLPFRK